MRSLMKHRGGAKARRPARSQRNRGLVLVMAVALLVLPVSNGAADVKDYVGMARADGVHVSASAREWLAVEQVDAGGSTAQASLDYLTGARAYAAGADPGETGTFALTTLFVALDQSWQNPVAAQSSPSEPEGHQERGSVTADAKSEDDIAMARVASGIASAEFAVSRSESASQVRRNPASGVLASTATSAVEGVEIADVLRIGAVRTRARTEVLPDGAEPERQASIEVTEMTIAGQRVALTEDGLVAGEESSVPLRTEQTEAIADVLDSHGITLGYLDPIETRDGIVSPALEIQLVREVPTLPQPVVITIQIGRTAAFASASGGGAQMFDGGEDDFDEALGDPGRDTPPEAGTAAPSGFEDLAPDTQREAPQPEAAALAGAAEPLAAPPNLPVQEELAPTSGRRLSGAGFPQGVLPNLYLVILLAGALAFGGSQVWCRVEAR